MRIHNRKGELFVPRFSPIISITHNLPNNFPNVFVRRLAKTNFQQFPSPNLQKNLANGKVIW
ncbi:MAG: hypothetical protein Kow0090_17500 [Myxococcota bacterium]